MEISKFQKLKGVFCFDENDGKKNAFNNIEIIKISRSRNINKYLEEESKFIYTHIFRIIIIYNK